MEVTAKSERTYGLVVGIEKYHETDWNVPGGGPALDALKFAQWLYQRGVPKQNIRLCLSVLEENNQLVGESELEAELATEQNLYNIVTNFLSPKSGDLLYIFWAGHGLISSERERRLICADATKKNWQNLDLNSLLLFLASDRFSIRNHICIIDGCANYVLESKERPTNLGVKTFPSGKPREDSQQFVLLATREGEKAEVNAADKTGYFSQAVREALVQATADTFPPNMKEVAEQVKQRFASSDKKQLPTYFYYRSWDGDKDEYHYNPFNIPHSIPQSTAIKFVEREEELEDLHQLLQANDVVAIIDETGLGGVGKTELAIQYSSQHLEDYAGGCCWFPQGVDLGTQLVEFGVVNFPNFIPPNELSLTGKVAYCWRNWQAGKVLLVFDDVKDWMQIKSYLPPKGSRFKVLITTRQNTGLTYPSLPLGELSPDGALELLTNLLGDEYVRREKETAQKLCELMGYIPIGLYQIAAYSRNRGRVLC